MKRLPASILVVSALTVAGIAVHEGYRGRAYDDGVGVRTMGFGGTHHEDGRQVQTGDTVTPERAVVMLARDADRIWRGDTPLYPREAAAYQSLAYNIGASAFCRSTLVKRLKQTPPDYAGACREILRWTRAGGRELPGLVKRRQAEHDLCIGSAP